MFDVGRKIFPGDRQKWRLIMAVLKSRDLSENDKVKLFILIMESGRFILRGR